jgi:gliding motility-associated-like protein
MMRRLFLYACLLFATVPLWGQQIVPSLAGTDFWVAFMYNNNSTYSVVCSLIIASEFECTAYISRPLDGWDTVVTLNDGIVRVEVPARVTSPSYGYSLCDDGWHIVTSAPAVVYASNHQYGSHDMTAVLPTPLLRCDYMTQTYGMQSTGQEVYVVAPYDSTMLSVVLNDYVTTYQGGVVYRPGDTLNVSMMGGQVCRLYCGLPSSLTSVGFCGTLFHSSKPVAVFQGHKGTSVPFAITTLDHLYEQCIPSDYWGRHFIVMPTVGRVPDTVGQQGGECVGDMVRVTALEDSCVVMIEGQNVATLAAGGSYTFLVANHAPSVSPSSLLHGEDLAFFQSDALSIVTSSPAQVLFYISGMAFGGVPGDPASVVVPPIEQGISRMVAAVYNSVLVTNHYINIVTDTNDVPMMTLDGESIASSFIPIAGGYSYAHLTIGEGKHLIDADTGRFLAVFYGLGSVESYAYIAGMAVRSAEYEVRADRHAVCLGDTVTIAIAKEDSLGVDWLLDGQFLTSGVDTLRIPFSTEGQHCVAVVITPVGDTVWEHITVHPVYHNDVVDSICNGDTLFWNGMALSASGAYPVPLQSVVGCDSVVTMHLSVLGNAPVPDIMIVPDCSNLGYTIRSSVGEHSDDIIAWWISLPSDSTLVSQPWDSIVVYPTVATDYALYIDGCRAFDTLFSLQPLHQPQARMEYSPMRINEDYPSITAIDRSVNAEGHYWWIDSLVLGESPEIHYTPNLSIDSFRLTLVAYNGPCTDTVTCVVPVDHFGFWVPNVFTPGRTDNNLFYPVTHDVVVEELVIYSRWGCRIARIAGPHPVWDGTLNGKPCQEGAYVWLVRYRANSDLSHLLEAYGTVTLLR